jgi:hypothetical protein
MVIFDPLFPLVQAFSGGLGVGMLQPEAGIIGMFNLIW